MSGASRNYSLVKTNRSRLQAKLQSLQPDSLLPCSLFMGLVRGRDWGVYGEASSGWGCGFGTAEHRGEPKVWACDALKLSSSLPHPTLIKIPSQSPGQEQTKKRALLTLSSAPCRGAEHFACTAGFHGPRPHRPYFTNHGSVLNGLAPVNGKTQGSGPYGEKVLAQAHSTLHRAASERAR